MPALTERRRQVIGALASKTRYFSDPDHPRHHEIAEYQRELATVRIEEFAEKVLAKSPPLTGEQRARLRALFADDGTTS